MLNVSPMKMFKSIKWQLQIWYGLILVFVLAGFGFTAYQLERGRQMRRIDGELHMRFGLLANAIHESLPPPPNRPRFGVPPPNQHPDDFPPRQNPAPKKLVLPPWTLGFFDASNLNGYYFVIERDGHEVERSTNAPASERYSLEPSQTINRLPVLQQNDSSVKYNGSVAVDAEYSNQRMATGQPGPAWMHGTFREVTTPLPSGEWILVGKNITPELKELHRTSLEFACIGAIVLLFGLAGGKWFVSRALYPIESISAAAVKISAGDLSQRINAAETESELGKLASVLNSTFARLDAAFAQQKQFASDAAHELRTPVSVILTQTQTALNRQREAAEYRETLEACQRAAQRMRKLIGALLELARLDAGQEQMKRSRFDFARTISDGIELTRPLAGERGVNIHSEMPSLEITGDPERLAQVVTNLLSNAIQYNKAGGKVRVKLEPQNGLAVLTVSDTGNGIPKEDLPHIFKRFYRGDKSRTGGGAGLGLAIARAIVEAHGGVIEVSSEEEVGTAFTVRLPV
jgi:two-component system, OmpR family, sensor kinase